MYDLYSEFRRIDTSGKHVYFVGANTSSGFVGTYGDIADEEKLKRLYIIKGGSGTGKSTIMRTIAERAELQGHENEYYLCSSDPCSLDCIVIDKEIAVLDGTFPHMLDMKFPGAASEIIDISRFWSVVKLEKKRKEIIYNTAMKSAEYASAYRYLKALDVFEKERSEAGAALFDFEKAVAFAKRFVGKIKPISAKHGQHVRKMSHALTMRGAYYVLPGDVDDYKTYHIRDRYGISELLLRILFDELQRNGYDTLTLHLPVCDRLYSVILPGERIMITAGGCEKENVINMARFIKKEYVRGVVGKYKIASKCAEETFAEVIDCLSCAAKYHFEIESIYKPAMNFDMLGEYVAKVADDILFRLCK